MKRVLFGAAALLLLGALIGGVTLLLKPTLDGTEKWFSIAGVVISTGLGMAGLRLTGRVQRVDEPPPASEAIDSAPADASSVAPATATDPVALPSGGQAVTGSVVRGGITQVRGVRGSVRIGSPSAKPFTGRSKAPRDFHPEPSGAPYGDQRIDDTWSTGPARQVDDVGGDVEIK